MLILFDIDGTLLLTNGAGVAAMGDAGREMFGEDFTFDGVAFSGRLDPLIWRDLAARNGIDDPDSHHDAFRATYRKYLTKRLTNDATAFALPGVKALIDGLRAHDHVTIGLLTGNYPETGRLKIEAAGLMPDAFTIAAWGIDGATRRDLPPVAMSRYHQHHARPIPFERVIIIGDTPHDVDCAKHCGCRVIGVATGAYSAQELADCGADLSLESLEATEDTIDWMMKQPATVSE